MMDDTPNTTDDKESELRKKGYCAEAAKIQSCFDTITLFHGGNSPKHCYISAPIANALKRNVFISKSLFGETIYGMKIHIMMHWEPDQFLCCHDILPDKVF